MAQVHAKTGLTEPVRHQVRQQSGSGEGPGRAGQGAVTAPGRPRRWKTWPSRWQQQPTATSSDRQRA